MKCLENTWVRTFLFILKRIYAIILRILQPVMWAGIILLIMICFVLSGSAILLITIPEYLFTGKLRLFHYVEIFGFNDCPEFLCEVGIRIGNYINQLYR